MMTDPLADLLTRIRNASRIERPAVDIPATKLKTAVAQVLKDEGFIADFHVGRMVTAEGAGHAEFREDTDYSKPKLILRVSLKYGEEGERVIRYIQRVSKPGCRKYIASTELRPVLDGLGIDILSTNKGVMSDRQAKARRLGGEVICRVW